MSKSETLKSDPLAEIRNLEPIECGEDAAKHFSFDEGYANLNHGMSKAGSLEYLEADYRKGSYGTYPIEVRSVFRHFQDRIEARPDAFVRYEYRTTLLDESRETIARYLDAPVGNCVLVPNASTAFDTVLRNLVFNPADVIICFATIYESFENTLRYITETTPAEVEKIHYVHPVSDKYICEAFEAMISSLRGKGKNPRIAIFDTISSVPGLRMPFEHLTELCRSHDVLSCIDAAHGVGHLPIDIQKLDPDFFMSNCHKWLHVPRPCAVLCVPARNQHLLRTTLPTGFDFVPRSAKPTALTGKSAFVSNFASVGTLDDTPYLCIQAGLEWRNRLTWRGKRGEEAVMDYTRDLARKGGQTVSSILQTETLDNEEATLSNCGFANVRLPLSVVDLTRNDSAKSEQISHWIMKTMILEHQTAVFVTFYGGSWWARLSAQVYLTLRDFERVGRLLKESCESVSRGEWQ